MRPDTADLAARQDRHHGGDQPPDHVRPRRLGNPGRSHHAHFGTEVSDDGYEQTWNRLLEGNPRRGITARTDGTMVAIAHYVFHASIWGSGGRCYLADLFVEPTVRRQGIATALITWAAQDAEAHGAPRLYWNTLADAPACALYDKVANVHPGLILYTYRRDADKDSSQR